MTRKRIRGRRMDELSSEESDMETSPPHNSFEEGISNRRSGYHNRTSQPQSRSHEGTSSAGNLTKSGSNLRRQGEGSSQPSTNPHMNEAHTSETQIYLQDNSTASGSTSVKKGRGPTKPNKDWGTKKKLILEWNEHHQPVGENAPILAKQLGSFARDGDLLPLIITSWDGHDPDVLDNIWQDVLDNTNAPLEYKNICMATVSERWRAWKHRVKADFYETKKTDDERRMNRPSELDPSHWEKLIKYWGRKSTKALANLNRNCRGCPVAVPRTGRTSFSNVRDKMEKNNESTDRPNVWKKTRLKKDGTYDEKDGAKELEEQLSTRLSVLSQEDREDPAMVDRVFIECVGGDGHGRARTMGIGVAAIKSRASSSQESRSEIASLRAEYDEKISNLRADFGQQMREQRQLIMAEMVAMMQNGGVPSPRGDTRFSEPTLQSSVGEGRDTSPVVPEGHMEDDN